MKHNYKKTTINYTSNENQQQLLKINEKIKIQTGKYFENRSTTLINYHIFKVRNYTSCHRWFYQTIKNWSAINQLDLLLCKVYIVVHLQSQTIGCCTLVLHSAAAPVLEGAYAVAHTDHDIPPADWHFYVTLSRHSSAAKCTN